MHDETFSLFVVLTALTTLSMPSIVQPEFAVFGLVLGILAHRAATKASIELSTSDDSAELPNA